MQKIPADSIINKGHVTPDIKIEKIWKKGALNPKYNYYWNLTDHYRVVFEESV